MTTTKTEDKEDVQRQALRTDRIDWMLDAKGEFLITIMSSLAQEKSRSISENTTWGKRKDEHWI